MDWTRDQIEALAPDAASLRAGRELAAARKWQAPGRSEGVCWGECQGSGTKPYRTQIAYDGPGFRCSCPSRKLPCKHALGLFLLSATEPGSLSAGPQPAWVSEWLAERAQGLQALPPAPKPVRKSVSPEAEARRQANVAAGLQELSLWCEDLLRRGLAGLPTEPYRFFDQMAARLVDAQAPGVARWIRDLASVSASGGNWAEQVLERLGLIQLLVSAYGRLEQLDPALQAEVKTQLGWTQSQEALLEAAGSWDHWLVLGQVYGVEDRLNIRRTWLLGANSGRYALLLDFAFGSQPYKQNWRPGSCLDAELVWFPSSLPLRALVKPDFEIRSLAPTPEAFSSWRALRRWRSEALAAQPWLELLPGCLSGVVPHLQIDRLWLRDAAGDSLPVWIGFEQNWRLLALSGGHPLTLSLEFDGERVYPLGVWCDEGYVAFSGASA